MYIFILLLSIFVARGVDKCGVVLHVTVVFFFFFFFSYSISTDGINNYGIME